MYVNRGLSRIDCLFLNLQGVPSLHPARNATIFNFVFPVIWVFLSRCSFPLLPLMGKRKRSLGFISPATRTINKRGERGALRLYMGERKVLIFSHWFLKVEIRERCFILVNVYYSERCRMFCWVYVGKDSVSVLFSNPGVD